ncbi:MAG: outer membrane protein assembly factor BamA [Parachlamydia sp.]|nr:outer membrane protein assembly factor BamA [Parachlamydia sp.]
MIKYIVSFLFLFALCQASLQAQTMHYENQVIEKLDVVVEQLPTGADFDRAGVQARIKTRAGDVFSHATFDSDLKTLAKEFDRVVPKLESINGKLYITLRIWPKPMIRTINWNGNERIKTKYLLKELGISPGTVFDRQAFNKAFHKLKAYYVKQGFFEAEINYHVSLDSLANEVDITITIQEGRAGKIKQIVFQGFSPCEQSEILDLIATKTYKLVLSWLNNEGLYNEEAIQHDQFVIINYLHNKGHADAKVRIEVSEAKQRDRIIVTIIAERGEPYYFGKITIQGNTLFSDEEIWNQVTICTGEPYSPEELQETRRYITEYYGRCGYIDAIIDFEPKLDCENGIYDVDLKIEEGAQFRVGMIKVYGNTCTQTRIILHETLLIPGEVFNIDKLQKTEQRLKNIGFFKNVNVYAVKTEGTSLLGGSYRDVHVEVEETNTGSFNTSFGFSTSEALFGSVGITERNFNYQGLAYLWEDGFRLIRGGGEYLHLGATFGTKSRKYELSWAKPYFMDTPWIVGFDIENSRTSYLSRHYTINATGLTLHTGYQVNPFLRTGWHYRLRDTHIQLSSDIDKHHEHEKLREHLRKAETPKERQQIRKSFKQQMEGINALRHQAKHAGLVSAVGTTLTYDSTDSPTMPTEGLKSRLAAEVAGVGGYHSFMGLSYLNAQYYPLHDCGVIKLRGDIRFLVPYGKTHFQTIPIDERLFLGGDTMVRGYRPWKLGKEFDKGDPEGGLSLQYYSIEYNYYLAKWSDVFCFFDAGQLSTRPFHFGRLYYSAGFGVRLKTLPGVPPVTLGMGFPINPKHRSQVKKFFFQLGGTF